MPLLPNQNISINPGEVAQQSVGRAGQVWDSVARVSGAVQNFGAELAVKRKQADTSSYVNTSSNDFERFVSERETALQSEYSGDPTGYSSAMKESINSWYEDRGASAPNDDAKIMWDQKFSSYSQNVDMRSEAWENSSRAKYQVGQIDESVRKDQAHLAQKPDPVKAAQFLTNTSNMVRDGIGLYYNETEAQERLRNYGSATASSLMEGLEANKQYSVGINLLNGKDPSSKILLENMDPKHIANYKDRFTKLSQAESEVSRHTLNMQANNINTAYMQGKKVPDETYNKLVSQSASMKPEDRAVFLDNLNTSKQYGEALKNIKTLPLDEVGKYTSFSIDHGEDIFNISSRTQMASEFQKNAAKVVEQRQNEAPQFWVQNDMSVKHASVAAMDPQSPQAMDAYTKLISAKKLADKSTSTKLLTPEMSKGYAALIKSGNPLAADSFRNSLMQGYGSSFGNVVNDMVKNKHIDSDLAMAMHIDDEATRISAFENLINKKAIDEAYEARPEKIKGEESDLFNDEQVMAVKQSIVANSGNAKDLWVTNGLDTILKMEYKAGRVKGMEPEDAKKAAIDKVIGSNFDVATYGKSSVPLMGQYKGMRDDVEDFMDEASSTPVLSQLNIKAPKSYLDFGSNTEATPAEMHSRYLKDISENSKWVLNDSQTGLKLTKLNPNGKLTLPVDSDGKPIEVKFDDMKAFMLKSSEKKKSEVDNIIKYGRKTAGF